MVAPAVKPATVRVAEPRPVVESPVDDSPERAPTAPRSARRRQTRPIRLRLPARSLATILLLGALAVAVALVLAQSAGAIHLGFLGPVA